MSPQFETMNLLPPILASIAKMGYTTPSPIQEQAIPHLMEGRDLLGIAQTGTGKTAAFTLPILNAIGKSYTKPKPTRPKCLILTPTRELASQIAENISKYSSGLKIKNCVVFGGVGHRPQIQNLSRGVDILVATPGRLLDLMNDGHVNYEHLEFFVLDEADRMLDMGFIRDIKKIISFLPKKKQTLLFSATMPKEIAGLAKSLLKDPVRIEITPQSTTVEKINQKVHFVEKRNKPELLNRIIKEKNIRRGLVFTRTKHGANKVVKYLLDKGVTSAAIHGNKSQGQRESALKNFKNGTVRILVATDIASRGIDVDKITHVINFELPNEPESYVHRIGRTARAGRDGSAIAMCDETEMGYLKSIEKSISLKIPVDEEHEFHISTKDLLIKLQNAPPKQVKRSYSRNSKTKSGNTQGSKKSSKKTTRRR